jgi:hypothetical protein
MFALWLFGSAKLAGRHIVEQWLRPIKNTAEFKNGSVNEPIFACILMK